MVPVFSVLQVFLAFGIGKVVMKYGSNLPTHPLRIFGGEEKAKTGGTKPPHSMPFLSSVASYLWRLMLTCVILMTSSYTYSIRYIVKPPKYMEKAYLCAITFQNSSALYETLPHRHLIKHYYSVPHRHLIKHCPNVI